MRLKKILIVSLYIAPFSGVGALRINYLSRFFAEKGIEVLVAKPGDDYYRHKDVENIYYTQARYRKYEFDLAANASGPMAKATELRKWYATIDRAIVENRDIDLIFFTGSPFYYFPLGAMFKRKYRIPYVLDFRDPWYLPDDNLYNLQSLKGKLTAGVYNLIQKWSVKNAEYVLNVIEPLTEQYQRLYSDLDQAKFLTMQNGYDDYILPEKVAGPADIAADPAFKLGILGKFAYYNAEDVQILCDSIKGLQGKVPVKVYHVGQREPLFEEMVKQYDLVDAYIPCGVKGYIEGIEFFAAMDALILNNRTPYALGTKVFDYIYLNKPILAFVDENYYLHTFLSQFAHYYNVRDCSRMTRAIEEIVAQGVKTLSSGQEIGLDEFSRGKQAEKLYRVITTGKNE